MKAGDVWAIALTALHVVLFVAFFSQEVLVDSSTCEVSCGNLMVDLLLLFTTPLSWVAAVAMSATVFVRRRSHRIVSLCCLIALAATILVLFASLPLPSH